MERRIDHPLGEISGGEFLVFRVFDIALHAWDLARSIGASERLAPDLVDIVLDIVEHGPPGMGFGIVALGHAPADASPQDQAARSHRSRLHVGDADRQRAPAGGSDVKPSSTEEDGRMSVTPWLAAHEGYYGPPLTHPARPRPGALARRPRLRRLRLLPEVGPAAPGPVA